MDKKTLLMIIFGAVPFCLFIIVLMTTAISSAIQSKRDKLSKDSPRYTSRFMVILWCAFLIYGGYTGLHSMFSTESNSSLNNVNNIKSSDTIKDENHIFVDIKYGNRIDVAKFDTIDTSKSSFIRNAYYDKNYQYLILNLDGTYYHRCGVPEYIRKEFKGAQSLGSYYNKYIKGEYDCRSVGTPIY